jgi:Putative MetA-pathway of phenol degradation
LTGLLRRLVLRCVCFVAFASAVVGSDAALAQGGPPLVTDDPETPGDGRWEINLATIGGHTAGRWDIAAPDADINYGWGAHVQLKLDVPWSFVHASDDGWKSGLGSAVVGVKWRFVDSEDAGFSLSTYPQFTWNWLSSSTRRGISATGRQLFLPIEAATVVGDWGLDAEFGRNFVQDGPNQWAAGFVLAHSCGAEVACMGEVRETIVPRKTQTLINFGVHWKLNESLFLLAAAGREFGPRTEDQLRGLFYLGFQILR